MKLTVAAPELVLRAVAVYLFVLILIRMSGKRQLGQMSATEFVALLLISNAVQNAMNGGDNSLGAGLILAVVLVAVSWAIAWINFRSRRIRSIFEGTPTLLIHKGKPVLANLKRELISEGELHTLLRKQGVHRFDMIKTAILESDGTITLERDDAVAALSKPLI